MAQEHHPLHRKKRKRTDAVSSGLKGDKHASPSTELVEEAADRLDILPAAEDTEAAKLRKKQKREKRKAKKLAAADFEAAKETASQIEACSTARQAAWLSASFTKATASSFIEAQGLEESSILKLGPGSSLEQRLTETASSLGIDTAAISKEQQHGAPAILFLSASAVGANNIVKMLLGLHQGVMKLFAKHIKMEEQATDLRSRAVNIASGTPNRVHKLAESGALKLDHLKLVVLDVHIDAKQRTILDVPETRDDFWRLFKGSLQARLVSGGTKIALVDCKLQNG